MVFWTVASVGLFAGVIFPQWHCKHIPRQIRFVTWRFNVVGDGTWAMRGRCKRDIFRDLEMCARWSESSIPVSHNVISWLNAATCPLLQLSHVALKNQPLKLRPARSKTRAIQSGPRSQDSSGVHHCRDGRFRGNLCSAGPNVHTIRRRLDITSTRDASWFVRYVTFHCPVASCCDIFNAMCNS